MVRQEFRTTYLGDSNFRKAKFIDDSQNFEHVSTNTWQTAYYIILLLPITPNVWWSTTTQNSLLQQSGAPKLQFGLVEPI